MSKNCCRLECIVQFIAAIRILLSGILIVISLMLLINMDKAVNYFGDCNNPTYTGIATEGFCNDDPEIIKEWLTIISTTVLILSIIEMAASIYLIFGILQRRHILLLPSICVRSLNLGLALPYLFISPGIEKVGAISRIGLASCLLYVEISLYKKIKAEKDHSLAPDMINLNLSRA